MRTIAAIIFIITAACSNGDPDLFNTGGEGGQGGEGGFNEACPYVDLPVTGEYASRGSVAEACRMDLNAVHRSPPHCREVWTSCVKLERDGLLGEPILFSCREVVETGGKILTPIFEGNDQGSCVIDPMPR